MICDPSGDQEGWCAYVGETLFVSWVAVERSSKLTVKISKFLVRNDVKAMVFPSGDQAGSKSPPDWVSIAVNPLPSAFMISDIIMVMLA